MGIRFAELYTDYRCSHCLPYSGAEPGTYLYSDGCTVRKHGDGTYSLVAYDSEPLDPHTHADFAAHPDSADTATHTDTGADR